MKAIKTTIQQEIQNINSKNHDLRIKWNIMGNYILMLGKKEKGCVRGLWPLKCSKLQQKYWI